MLHYAGPPQVGGVELTMAAHAGFLAQRAIPVRIVAGVGGHVGEGIETVILPELGSRGEEIDHINRELAAWKVSDRFEALVDRIAGRLAPAVDGASVLIAHNVLTLHKNLALTTALAAMHEAGALPPVVAWCHDFAWIDPVYDADMHPGLPWDLLRRPWPGVRYVVVSADRQFRLASLLGMPTGDITVVPPGVQLEAFLKLEPGTAALLDRLHLRAADPLLLLPARITRRKNIELAVAIVAGLRRQEMEPVLVITGPPGPHNPTNTSYLAALRDSARAQYVEKSIVFLHDHVAPVDDATIADLFRIADALLFPSRAEGFGIPLLEAGLSGLPIFCSDLAVFKEVAPAADVVFALHEEPNAIAERIATTLRKDARYSLRRRVRLDYTWETVCERHLIPLLDQAVGLPP
jgi:glycosyltransferase involved in cell wall biosynthesis